MDIDQRGETAGTLFHREHHTADGCDDLIGHGVYTRLGHRLSGHGNAEECFHRIQTDYHQDHTGGGIAAATYLYIRHILQHDPFGRSVPGAVSLCEDYRRDIRDARRVAALAICRGRTADP